jgi:hypothetical protein
MKKKGKLVMKKNHHVKKNSKVEVIKMTPAVKEQFKINNEKKKTVMKDLSEHREEINA